MRTGLPAQPVAILLSAAADCGHNHVHFWTARAHRAPGIGRAANRTRFDDLQSTDEESEDLLKLPD
jgi:hypothetical protein